MAVPESTDDLTPAVELILQPLVVEALVAIDEGKALDDALPADVESVVLAAAVHRLVAIGAVYPATDDPFERHQVSERGRKLLHRLDRLAAILAAEPLVRGRD